MGDNDQELSRLKRTQRILIRSIIAVLILILSTGIYLGYQYTRMVMDNIEAESFTPEEVAITPRVTEKIREYTESKPTEKIENILLIGIDSDLNEDAPQRSDSMTIVSLDGIHGSIKLSSLMRDTYVKIEDHGTDKLNHSFAFGGTKLLLRTINQNFDLDVKDYVLVNFNDLIDIIDAMGGIDLFVTWEEAMYMNFNIQNINELNGTDIEELEIKSQNIRVNGAQALSYARIRYLDSDYKRTERQRIVLLKAYERVRKTPLIRLPGTVARLSRYVRTSLDERQILDLAYTALSSDFQIHGLHFPTFQTSRESTKGSWHIVIDRKETTKEIHEWIFRDIDPYRQMTLTEIREENNRKDSEDRDGEKDGDLDGGRPGTEDPEQADRDDQGPEEGSEQGIPAE